MLQLPAMTAAAGGGALAAILAGRAHARIVRGLAHFDGAIEQVLKSLQQLGLAIVPVSQKQRGTALVAPDRKVGHPVTFLGGLVAALGGHCI